MWGEEEMEREEGMENLQDRFLRWILGMERRIYQDIWREKSCEKINCEVNQRKEHRDLRRGCRKRMGTG